MAQAGGGGGGTPPFPNLPSPFPSPFPAKPGTGPGPVTDGYPSTNPKYANQLLTLAFPMAGQGRSQLARGIMMWDNAVIQNYGECVIEFLFNPSEVQVSNSMYTDDMTAMLMFRSQNDDATVRAPLSQQVSFSLLFDRTYELWGAYHTDGTPRQGGAINHAAGPTVNPANMSNPAISGVMSDINMFKKLTGMFDNNNASNTLASPSNTGASQTTSADVAAAITAGNTSVKWFQGIMMLMETWVYFGNPVGAVYYGYISEWDITISHWTQYMVPMRCEIDITMNLLIPHGNYQGALGPGANWANLPGGSNIGNPGPNPGGSSRSTAGRGGR